jgi:hypothetical protein
MRPEDENKFKPYSFNNTELLSLIFFSPHFWLTRYPTLNVFQLWELSNLCVR